MSGRADTALTRRRFLQRSLLALPALSFAGAALPAAAAAAVNAACRTQRLRDDLGRALHLPAGRVLERVICTDEAAQQLVLSVAPEALAALVGQTPAYAVLPEQAAGLQTYGSFAEGEKGTAALFDAQLVVGTFDATADAHAREEGGAGDARSAQDANAPLGARAARETAGRLDAAGVSSFWLDGSVEALARSVRTAGRLLDRGARARQVAGYVERTLAELHTAPDGARADERPEVLYLSGRIGLTARSFEKPFAYALQLAGASNPAEPTTMRKAYSSGIGYAQSADDDGNVRLEEGELARMNPRYIFCDGEYNGIGAIADANTGLRLHPALEGLDALCEGRVRVAPATPAPWLESSSGLVCLLGAQWAHAEIYGHDAREAVRGFFAEVFQRDLNDSQIQALLA